MTISIDTSRQGYHYPGGYHGNSQGKAPPVSLGKKLSQIWSKEESLHLTTDHNLKVTELVIERPDVPDASKLSLSLDSHKLNNESVETLVS